MWRKSAPSLFALALAATSLAAQNPSGAGPSARDSALSRQLKARPGDSLGRLEVPEAAGRGVAAVTARDNSAIVRALEEKIRCTCGCNLSVYTCRTTDFTCTTSPAMHQVVLARLDSGMTKAQILDKLSRTDEAKAVMATALDLPGASSIEIHQYGRQLLAQGKKTEAMAVFQKNQKRFGDAWPIHVGLARGYSAMGDYKTALEHAQKALAQAPDPLNKNSLAAAVEKLKQGKDMNVGS